MLSDIISLLIGLLAVRIAKRRSNINTFGWVRAEVVGANINTVFLLALCLTIIFDSIKRFIEPEPIVNVNLLLIVGSIGLGINIIGLLLFRGFHGHSHSGVNEVHRHSHNEGEHGHSHDATNKLKLTKRLKKSIEMKEDMTESDKNNTTAETYDDDIDPLEVIIASSEFQRHSFRALDEAIVDCTCHAHDALQCTHSHSPNVDAADSSTKNVRPKKTSSMNMHGVFLHVLADALGSVVVIISSLIIKFVPHDPENHKHWTVYVDPTLSVLIVIIITVSAIPLLKETTYVLLQTVPRNIEVDSLKKQLLDHVPEIDGIHELHIWRLTSSAIIATAHLRRRSLTDYMAVANKVKRFFHGVGIHSTTIQYECSDDERQDYLVKKNKKDDESKSAEVDCLLGCPDESCDTKTCCTKDSIRTDAISSITKDGTTHEQPADVIETTIKMENEPSQPYNIGHNIHTQAIEKDPLLKSDQA
ncbi:unnamed protein product [Rotaria sp. Silwood1]|nr:unnamed protein product [Rotaria sp. Silwood1]CAF1464491.1 unnamed protein product [Rotaria sp. Silwood1]CAF3803314.1 unnamed protein product [Rotaria sp. Silwood1]CAF4945033.1 unnamed protein product [Rotaria sp. Silwood1]